MRNFKLFCLLSFILICGCKQRPENNKVVIAYVTSWGSSTPDPTYITHINYAFGHVNETFDGIRIDNEDRLKSIVKLKKKKPSLKILLSVGGWESGGFSEMASTEKGRRAFAEDCKRVIDEFGLDGVDIDWEYPTSSVAGISSSPKDSTHFTFLMGDIRSAIGKEKLLTIATDASAKFIQFSAIKKYVNFVNIMTYDMARLPHHHAPLFSSEMTGKATCESSVSAHANAGVPIERLVLGIPFFGYATEELQAFRSYGKIKTLQGYTSCWDEFAKIPYLTDTSGNVICNYENEESIREKCQYLNDMGMLGAMYWEYDNDDEQGTLRKAVYEGVFATPSSPE